MPPSPLPHLSLLNQFSNSATLFINVWTSFEEPPALSNGDDSITSTFGVDVVNANCLPIVKWSKITRWQRQFILFLYNIITYKKFRAQPLFPIQDGQKQQANWKLLRSTQFHHRWYKKHAIGYQRYHPTCRNHQKTSCGTKKLYRQINHILLRNVRPMETRKTLSRKRNCTRRKQNRTAWKTTR